MSGIYITDQQVANQPLAIGTDKPMKAADYDLYDLLWQSAWASKEKFWFDWRGCQINANGVITSVLGWCNGTDGQPQSLGVFTGQTASLRRFVVDVTTGAKGIGMAYPVGTGSAWTSSLYGSANTKLPAAGSGSELAVYALVQQPTAHNGAFVSTDDGNNPGADVFGMGFNTTDDRLAAYSAGVSSGNPTVKQTNSNINDGSVTLYKVGMDGSSTVIMKRNGTSLALGTSTIGAVASRRIRVGQWSQSGSSNAMDGIVMSLVGVPVAAGSDADLAMKNYCTAWKPDITIA